MAAMSVRQSEDNNPLAALQSGQNTPGRSVAEIPASDPIERCHQVDGSTLLYVGIVPKKPGTKVSKAPPRTLHSRLTNHCNGNAEGSTLRLTLGCLLSERL